MKRVPLSKSDILGWSVRTGEWSLYQDTRGSGRPRTTQRKVASVPSGRVWLAGPSSMTGGAFREVATVRRACQLSDPAELTALHTVPMPLSLRLTSYGMQDLLFTPSIYGLIFLFICQIIHSTYSYLNGELVESFRRQVRSELSRGVSWEHQ